MQEYTKRFSGSGTGLYRPAILLEIGSSFVAKSEPSKKKALTRPISGNCPNLAGDEGFEPPITGPEPGALPLGQSPIIHYCSLLTDISQDGLRSLWWLG